MNIKRFTAYKVDMALNKPYTIAFEHVTSVENVFLEVELSNGLVGIGAASPSEFVIGETIETTLAHLQSNTLDSWVGRDIRTFRQLIDESAVAFAKHPATRAAIDIALHDAFGKYLGVPIAQFYGQKHAALPTSVTIGIMNVADTLAEAAEYQRLGFRVLKVKTGLQLDEDIERCVKLRERFGDYFTIRTDANQGYDLSQTLAFVNATRHLGLELIEQPMPVGTEALMRTLPDEVKLILACDESLHGAESAVLLAQVPRTCGIFNIKLMKCGGLLGAFEIASVAEATHTQLFWGCFDESIASITAALHAALACRNTRYLDLDGSLDLAEDVVNGGFVLHEGLMSIGTAPGFGCEMLAR